MPSSNAAAILSRATGKISLSVTFHHSVATSYEKHLDFQSDEHIIPIQSSAAPHFVMDEVSSPFMANLDSPWMQVRSELAVNISGGNKGLDCML